MKWMAAFGLLLFLGLAACRKKDVFCSKRYTRIPGTVHFIGFQPSELNTILLNYYRQGSQFTQLIRRDTMAFSNIQMKHDTAYYGMAGFINLPDADELELMLPATSDRFQISDVRYDGDSIYYYTAQYGECNMKGTPFWPPDSATVNGKRIRLGPTSGAQTSAYLSR